MILRSADGSRRMMKILRIMNGNLRVTRTKIQVKTAQPLHKLSRKKLMGITEKSPSRNVKTYRIPSKAGHIQRAERPSSPCFSQRILKSPESGSLCRRYGISTAIGAISARAGGRQAGAQVEEPRVPYFAGLRTRGCTQADRCTDG